MKIILTEDQLRDVLSELTTKLKSPFSVEGSQHMIYDSKNNPNIVFKIGYPYFVDKWLDIFKKHHNIFQRYIKLGL